jgi:hypothetical protein
MKVSCLYMIIKTFKEVVKDYNKKYHTNYKTLYSNTLDIMSLLEDLYCEYDVEINNNTVELY